MEKNLGRDDIVKALSDMQKFKESFLEKRSVFLWGPVNDQSAEDIVARMLYLDQQSNDEIKFFISSPGGAVTSGMVIYDTMQMMKSPVSTICMGLAASMGSLLLSGGERGRRFIFPHGRVMIHQPLMGQLFGQASDIQIHAKEIVKTKELIAQILADNTSQSIERVRADFERDYWMNASESLDYGVVDSMMEKL